MLNRENAPYYPTFTWQEGQAMRGRKGILAFLEGTLPGRRRTCKNEKSIARNTVAFSLGGMVYVTFRRTNILTFDKQGRPILRMEGWNTVTTRERMNRFLPKRWTVFNHKGEAFVGYWSGTGAALTLKKYPFVECMRLNLNGTVTYPRKD